MPVNTRQKCYDIVKSERCPSPSRKTSVGNCKYRRVLEVNIDIIDRGRNEIFSPLPIKDRLRSSTRN
jgi:hypothetical protein